MILLWALRGTTIWLMQLWLVVRHGPVSAPLHLVTRWVCLVLGLPVVVILPWHRTPIVFRVFTIVTRLAG